MIKRLWLRITGKCPPFTHRYRINLRATERFNEDKLYLFGSKVYVCRVCDHAKVVWPHDVL